MYVLKGIWELAPPQTDFLKRNKNGLVLFTEVGERSHHGQYTPPLPYTNSPLSKYASSSHLLSVSPVLFLHLFTPSLSSTASNRRS